MYICAVTYMCAVYMFADKHAYVATFTKYGPIHTHVHTHTHKTHTHTLTHTQTHTLTHTHTHTHTHTQS